MKKILSGLLLLFLALGASAQELVTATVTVVDIPNNGDTIVVNGNTRTWTNAPLSSVSWIPATNSIAGNTTNLFLHIAATPFTALGLSYAAADAIRLQGSLVAVSFAGSWATVSYSTQLVTSLIAVRVPVAGIPLATNRTFVGVNLLKAINDYATNAFDNNAPALTNYLSLGPAAQEVVGAKLFQSISGTNTSLVGGIISGAAITNSTYAGTVVELTNGLWSSAILVGPTFTNAVNHGNAFQSPGIGSESQQLGQSAEANADNSTAIGDGSVVNGLGGTGLGSQATVESTAPYGVALAFKATVSGGAAVAIGTFADARNTNSMALGVNTVAMHDNSIAFANDTTTTTNNQIRLGNSGHTLSVPGDGSFGQKLAVGSDNYLSWPADLNRGIAFLNGSSPNAQATNAWVLYSEAAEPFYRTGLASEGAEQNNRLHNRGATVTGTGTAYSFTASTARVDYSGQGAEILLPSAGTYFVTGVVTVINGATANDEYHVKLRNFEDDLDITDSERVISNMAASTIAQIHLQNVITVSESRTIVVWGHNGTAARGTSDPATTSLSYVRLY